MANIKPILLDLPTEGEIFPFPGFQTEPAKTCFSSAVNEIHLKLFNSLSLPPMSQYSIFANMPVLSMITNFSPTGDFERVYLVMENSPENRSRNERRTARNVPVRNTWNGPKAGFRQ